MYREIAIYCFRYLGFTSFKQVDELTLEQFEIMRKAHEYSEVDLDYRIHQLAYLGFVATGKKKAGKDRQKPIYSTFKKFYDYEKALKKVDEKDEAHNLMDAYRRAEGR